MSIVIIFIFIKYYFSFLQTVEAMDYSFETVLFAVQLCSVFMFQILDALRVHNPKAHV